MDAYLKKEQIGTLFVWVGALEGGFGGWVVGQGGQAQNRTCLPSEFSFLPPVPHLNNSVVGQKRMYALYMTVYLVISLPKMPCIHLVYMVLANPN